MRVEGIKMCCSCARSPSCGDEVKTLLPPATKKTWPGRSNEPWEAACGWFIKTQTSTNPQDSYNYDGWHKHTNPTKTKGVFWRFMLLRTKISSCGFDTSSKFGASTLTTSNENAGFRLHWEQWGNYMSARLTDNGGDLSGKQREILSQSHRIVTGQKRPKDPEPRPQICFQPDNRRPTRGLTKSRVLRSAPHTVWHLAPAHCYWNVGSMSQKGCESPHFTGQQLSCWWLCFVHFLSPLFSRAGTLLSQGGWAGLSQGIG